MTAHTALIARLREHAAMHDELAQTGDEEQRQWAADLREAAMELEASAGAVAAERERWAPLLGLLAERLAARLGTNADEWQDVRAARELIEA